MIMKLLDNKYFKLLNKIYPYLIFLVLIVIFFYKFFFKGLLPIPVDFVVGTYFPWLDYKWGGYGAGVPVKNPLLADVPSLIYPLRILVADSIKRGIVPLWNNFQFAGYPLMANFQSAVFNPFNLFFIFLKNHIAWSLQIIIQPLLSMVFTYLFLISLKLKKGAAIIGAVVYAFSGFNAIWLTYGIHGFVASTIPLLLFLVNKIIESDKYLWKVLLSSTVCLQIFFGYPQLTIYTVILVGLWTVFRNYRKTIDVFVFGILGVLLSSIQLIPGYEMFVNSQRLVEGVSGGQEVAFLQYNQLINLIIPDFYGNPATYNYWGSGNYTNLVAYSGITALFFSALTFLKIKFPQRKPSFPSIFFLGLFFLI